MSTMQQRRRPGSRASSLAYGRPLPPHRNSIDLWGSAPVAEPTPRPGFPRPKQAPAADDDSSVLSLDRPAGVGYLSGSIAGLEHDHTAAAEAAAAFGAADFVPGDDVSVGSDSAASSVSERIAEFTAESEIVSPDSSYSVSSSMLGARARTPIILRPGSSSSSSGSGSSGSSGSSGGGERQALGEDADPRVFSPELQLDSFDKDDLSAMNEPPTTDFFLGLTGRLPSSSSARGGKAFPVTPVQGGVRKQPGYTAVGLATSPTAAGGSSSNISVGLSGSPGGGGSSSGFTGPFPGGTSRVPGCHRPGYGIGAPSQPVHARSGLFPRPLPATAEESAWRVAEVLARARPGTRTSGECSEVRERERETERERVYTTLVSIGVARVGSQRAARRFRRGSRVLEGVTRSKRSLCVSLSMCTFQLCCCYCCCCCCCCC
jgi:hypothetical protein